MEKLNFPLKSGKLKWEKIATFKKSVILGREKLQYWNILHMV